MSATLPSNLSEELLPMSFPATTESPFMEILTSRHLCELELARIGLALNCHRLPFQEAFVLGKSYATEDRDKISACLRISLYHLGHTPHQELSLSEWYYWLALRRWIILSQYRENDSAALKASPHAYN